MSANSVKGKLRIVAEDTGGTFTFDANSENEVEQVQHIGIEGLISCIGVYWPVDERRCFCTHLNVQFESDTNDYHLFYDVQQQSEVEQIKDRIKSLLDEESIRSEWGNIPETYRKQAVLVCPDLGRSRKVKGIMRVGLCAVEACKEWLGVSDLAVDIVNAAFVVEHGAGVVETLPFSAHEAPHWDDWTRTEETGEHVRMWELSVPRD